MVKELGIAFVDIMRPVVEHPDPPSLYTFQTFRHFNEIGHALVARFAVNAFNRVLDQ